MESIGPVTIDSSVYLSARFSDEPTHAACRELLQLLRDDRRQLILPLLVQPEVAGNLARRIGNAEAAAAHAASLLRGEHVTPVPLGSGLAAEAAQLAAEYRLRGADAVFAAVAQRYGSILITCDREQRERAAPFVRTLTPGEALEELGG